MRVVSLLFCLVWLSFKCDANAVNTLKWSKSYTLKAVLTVSNANLSEPYQVWVNGDTYRSRVDFYGGLDKLYRQWNEIDKTFDYFKIHPDRTGKSDKEVCDKLPSTAEETKMYALNSYLPIKPWTFVRAEEVNNTKSKKFVYEHSIKIRKEITAKIVYAVWVVFKKDFKDGTAVPIRFVYEMKFENRTLYNFCHDYTYFDDSEPDVQTLLMPLGMQCNLSNETFPHGTNDLLATYIDPTIDDVRRAFDESRQNKSLMTVKLYLNRDGQIKQKYQIMPEFLRSKTISNANGNTFHWSSKSYTLKAVLTVPAANISEPYQVWIDGDTRKSRVDFYGGMDKLYREYDTETEEYRYFKINPISNNNFDSKEECYEVDAKSSEVRTYATNSYLPIKRWTYVGNENLNNAETKKFVYEYSIKVNGNTGGKVVYTVWVKIEKPAGTAVPVRYVYELISGTKVLDNFRHDYYYFDDSKPDATMLEKPPGMKCKLLNVESLNQPIDPIVEYIEPNLEYSRVENAFDRFKTKHNKMYKNEDEHFKRMNIFKDNLRFINSFNRRHRSFTVGVNHLADLSKEEMAVFLGTISKNNKVEEGSGDYDGDDDDDNDIDSLTGINGKFDWRDYGAVSSVKDQTPFCGGCYAFTTAAAIESSAYVARGCKNLDEVSEQAIIDCSWGNTSSDDGNLGCRGGTYEFALKWVKKYGAPPKSEYGPYLAMEGRCHAAEMNKLFRIKEYHHLQSKKRVIKEILRKNGPLLASIDSNHQSFLLYSSGVYNEPACSNNPNDRTHGVNIVGYGKENGEEHWIIKNSFGAAWGENGYMRLAMQRNQCGIKNYVYTVNFAKNKSENCKSLK